MDLSDKQKQNNNYLYKNNQMNLTIKIIQEFLIGIQIQPFNM